MNISCQNVISIERPGQGIADLCGAGLNKICLPIYVKFPEQEENAKTEKLLKKYAPDTILERYEDFIRRCKGSNLQITCLEAPAVSQKSDIDTVLPMLEVSIIQCLKLCEITECKYLHITLPFKNYVFLSKAVERARELGIMFLLKNQLKNMGGHMIRGFCAEAAEAADQIDRLNNKFGCDIFGFCVDTGVCNICGNNMQTFIDILGNRIKAVVLRENDGHKDASMLPFTYAYSETDWLGAIRGLRGINFDGELIVDFSSTYDSFSPLLRPVLYPLVKRTAEYFKWQIEIENNLKKYKKFVLFGAGNMCRNYMKCYGEKYPPLFTCDNNPKLWGTTFEGLEVKNPVELRDLPKNYCVVICNIFYREIEMQLKEMGIENIGYFNDEYMPSFYFDRLDIGK